MWTQLRTFLMRGSILELAVGVIIGAAFGKIVSALVDNILMPLIGIAMGGVNFHSLSIKILGVDIGFGAFLQAIFDFSLIGVVLFLLLRIAGKNPVPEPLPPPAITTEELLMEIRDLLKEQRVQ